MRHKRVFWILIGDKNTGSSRIHGYNVHEALIKKGIQSKIQYNSTRALTRKEKLKLLLFLRKGDLLILQKRKELSLKKLLRYLKLKGVKIAFIDCDLPVCDITLVQYFDYIICPSSNLSELYKNKHPNKLVTYIPDAVEHFSNKIPSNNNKAIYFGWLTDNRMEQVKSLKKLFKSVDWDLVIMSNRREADIPWFNWEDEERFHIIGQHNVSLIPVVGDEASKYKSANRVLQSLALGNIVLCGDIEAYREVIVNGKNGFICSTPDQWLNALKELSNENKRSEIIKKGFETAENYSMDKIILKWISFLQL
ncbi:MAG: hypothetical protein CMP05_00225 [Xanthomarina sp.]|uniref:glycosyltransferase n=1 Tax=Xanthomarina sp. TaxID=1931211 RepID=UPI000C452B3E|nr:glycosyltransferase [Xanthomarina sp.]MAL23610.1 hypothetical protein [Xanthomarina sp.]MBF60410.1 hypothetical protein [Xanthomarina sp.]HAB28699.1 hypothetical protein [Xanthomarina gelatinilytica]|tara:strand:+ start:3124 stop:4047 length:924 start_codon:yes stop_codon:yes gene_type:complete